MAGTGFSFSGTSSASSSSTSFGFSNPSSTSAPSFGFGSSTSSTTTSPFGVSPFFGSSSSAGTASSTTASPFGASPLFGSSSGAAPTSSLFGSSSGTASTSNFFGSSSSGTPPASNFFGSGSGNAPNFFGSSSGGAPTSSLFGSSSSSTGQTASLFGSTSSNPVPSSPSPSPSPLGTSTVFGSPAPGSSNLFGSGAPTPSLFGASSAASASNTSSPLFGSGSAITSSLFGSSTPAPTSATNAPVFGSGAALNTGQFGSSTSAPTAAATVPLFGSGSAPAGMFGSSTPSSLTTTGGTSSSLFGPSSGSTPGLFGSSSLIGSSSASPLSGTPSTHSSSSASSAPGFSFPSSPNSTSAFPLSINTSSSAASASAPGFSFPNASTSTSSAPGLSFPASSASSVPAFSTAPSSTTSSGFSFLKSTSSPASSASATVSSSSSSGFSFGTTGFSSSALTSSLSSAPASKPVAFGTTPSALFSTVTTTTTTNDSALVAASVSSAGTSASSGLTFPASSGTSSTGSTPLLTSASAPTSGFTGFSTTSTPASSPGNTSSFSLSLKSPTTAALSASQTQSTTALPSFGCCSNSSSIHLGVGLGGYGVWSEGEEVSERFKMPIDQMAELEFIQSVLPVGVEDEDEKGDATGKDENVAYGVSACSIDTTAKSVAKEMASPTAQAHSSTSAMASGAEACPPMEGLKYEATPVAQNQTTKAVVNDSSENLSSESEVFDGNELGHPAHGNELGQITEVEFIQSVLPVGVVDEAEKGDATGKDENVVRGVSACSIDTTAKPVVKEMTSLTAQAHSSTSAMASGVEACSPMEGLTYEATPVAKSQSTKLVVNDSSENSSSESEVLDGKELGHSACGSFMPLEVPLCSDFKQLNLALQNTLSLQKAHLIEQVLRKYGDITKGSILKSIEAKIAFLQLVAEVVEQLHSHTLGTIGAHEMQIIQKWTDDAAAVGFHVEWLQQRIKKIVSISKYEDNLMRLSEISEKINAAKIALLEMELQQMILKKEIDFVKADIDREDFCGSNLCEGLF